MNFGLFIKTRDLFQVLILCYKDTDLRETQKSKQILNYEEKFMDTKNLKKKHWKGTSLRDKNRNKISNIKSKQIETNKLSYWTVYNSFNINFQLTEIPLPVRFIFIYLVPDDWDRDVREVGRTMGTLLSNPVSFHILCNLRFSVLIFNNKMQQHSQSLMSLFCGCSLVNL